MENRDLKEKMKINAKYIELAKKMGLFLDNPNFMKSKDKIIAHWIFELDVEKEEKIFVNEILPAFKRWFSYGLNLPKVGKEYKVLLLAEKEGILINNESFQCILNLMMRKKLFNFTEDFKQIKQIIENLEQFQKEEIPITEKFSYFYDFFLDLKKKKERTDLSTFFFLLDCDNFSLKQLRTFYNDKKRIEATYDYSPFSVDEVIRLKDYLELKNGGFLFYIKELEEKQKILQEKLQNTKGIFFKKSIDNNQVKIFFASFKDGNFEKMQTASGKLINYGKDFVVLKETEKSPLFLTIKEDETKIITHIVSLSGEFLYENKYLQDQRAILKLKKMIAEIKSENLVEQYLKKSGTLEGLAYLKVSGLAFLCSVRPYVDPIHNLFAYCFEIIYENFKKILGLAQIVEYSRVSFYYIESVSKQFDYEFPIHQVLPKKALNFAERICFYIVLNDIHKFEESLDEFYNWEQKLIIHKKN